MKSVNLIQWMAVIMMLTSCGGNEEPQRVEHVKVKTLQVNATGSMGKQSYSGTITGEKMVELSFTQAGTLSGMMVENGDFVRQGQLVASIENTMANSNMQTVNAQLEQVRDAYNRAKVMYESESIPEVEWIDAQSKLRQAEAQARMASKGMGDTRLYAPMSGFVTGKNAEKGQNVDAGATVMKIIQIDKVKVKFSVPEREIGQLRKGQQVSMEVMSLGNKTFDGKIVEVGKEADTMTHSFVLNALFDNRGHELLPGMVCQLAVGQTDARQRITIPASAVMLNADNTCYVWLVRNGKAVKSDVTLGDEDRFGITVISGLANGDHLIVEGHQKVSEGSEVTIN